MNPDARPVATTRDRTALGLVGLLFALHVALYPFAALVVDSGRDLANGFAIASGAGVPAYGPALFGTWHLGPAWYLLLALPLALGGGVGATAVFVGVLAAMKIPLAYALGRRIGDRTLALLCAVAAALPGWQILGALVLSHTALVEPLLYAMLLCCVIAVRQRRPWLAVVAALLLALALHAHPTALVGAPAVAWSLWCSMPGRDVMRRVVIVAVAALAFLVPFLPVLVAEAQAGWPQLAGTGRYLGESGFGARFTRIPEVAWGVAWHGSVFVREFLLARVPLLGGLWQVAIVLAWLGALAGAVHAWRRRDLRPVFAVIAWLLAVAFVCLLRDATPAWMTYALAPLQVLAWALGWRVLLARDRDAWVAHGVALFACIVSVALIVDRVAVSRAGLQAIPGHAVGDVARAPLAESPSRFWLTAYGHDAVMRQVCGDDTAVALHGDLAAAIDFGQGVAASLHCSNVPLLGGRDGARHIAGLPRAVAATLGLQGESLAGFILLTPRRVVFPERGVAAAPDTAYRADTLAVLAANGMTTQMIEVACDPGEWLVISNRLPDLNPLQLDVRDASGPRTPRLAQLASTYHACDGTPLQVKLQTLDPASIDIVVLPGR